MKKIARKLTLSRSALISSMLLGTLLAGQTVSAQQAPEKEREGRQLRDGRGGVVPSIPVILDGVKFPAGALPPSKSGRTFLVTAEDEENGTVHAFSSHEVALEFMRLNFTEKTCAHPYFFSAFNKNRGGGGSDYIYMDMNFTTGDPDIYWNLDFDGWNNTISWVAGACNGFTTALYSCRDFEMDSDYFCADPDRMYVQPGQIITDLLPYGFNNRTSSIKFGS